MKKAILLLILLVFAATLIFAKDYKYKSDPWDKDKINVLIKNGAQTGYYKKNAWSGDWNTLKIKA